MKLFKRKMGKKQKAALNALADGIECGAKLHPQAQTSILMEDMTGTLKTCALGAALACQWAKEGREIGKYDTESFTQFGKTSYDEILALYGVENKTGLNLIRVQHAIRDEREMVADEYHSVADFIWHLNDWAHWSREQIAAFLRELE